MKKVAKSRTPAKKKRKDWDEHQAEIRDAYIRIAAIKKHCPTIRELAAEAGFAKATIEKHIKEIKFEPIKSKMRILTPDILIAIFNSAKRGSSSSQKLWLQVMEGFSEQSNINHTNDGEAFDAMTPVVIGSVDEPDKSKSSSK